MCDFDDIIRASADFLCAESSLVGVSSKRHAAVDRAAMRVLSARHRCRHSSCGMRELKMLKHRDDVAPCGIVNQTAAPRVRPAGRCCYLASPATTVGKKSIHNQRVIAGAGAAASSRSICYQRRCLDISTRQHAGNLLKSQEAKSKRKEIAFHAGDEDEGLRKAVCARKSPRRWCSDAFIYISMLHIWRRGAGVMLA